MVDKRFFRTFKSDLLDIDAHWDSRLSYSENKNNILGKAKRLGLYKPMEDGYKGSPIYYENKAQEIHNKRSERSKAIDSIRNAKRTFDNRTLTRNQFKKWKKDPNKYDIKNVDTKSTYSKPKPFKSYRDSIFNIDII
jgi:hypothetical protein